MKDQFNRVKPYSPTAATTANSPARFPAMDPTIWSRLPEELLELVLSFLPLKTFFNLRSTCKRFNALVFSPSFVSKLSSSAAGFPSFLLLSHPQCHRSFALYDSSLATWRDLSLSSLSSSAPNTSPSSSSLLSASNGLLCFSLPSSSSFLVCNALARSSRVVKFPFYPFASDTLSLVSTHSGYYIFTASSRSSFNSTFVYYSRTGSWREFDAFEPILSENYHEKGVFFNGCLYFTTPEPFSVVSFDLESGKWERSETELPHDLTFVRLVSGGERKLYLVGGIGRNGISKSMKLWELSEERNSWVEIERVPEMMCQKFMSVCYHNYQHVYCFWHQGMLCICCYTWPEILYYKSSRRTWHWLPKCPSLPEKWSCGFRWFSFVPELYASV